jgi:hypothetical protein
MALRFIRFRLSDKGRDRPFPHGIETLDHAVLFSSIFHSARVDRAVGCSPALASISSGLSAAASGAVMPAMGTKSREVIWGGTIMGAKIRAQGAREEAQKAASEADRAEAYAWSVRMEGYGGPRSIFVDSAKRPTPPQSRTSWSSGPSKR